MKYDINYDVSALGLACLESFGTDDYDLIEKVWEDSEKMLSDDWLALYKKLLSGVYDCLSYDSGKDENRRSLVYLFTRSSRQGVEIQKTVFLSVPGEELIPLSHRDFRTFIDFRRDGFPDGVTVTAA